MVYGWAVGVWLAMVFAYLLREPIFNHIKALVADDDELEWYGKTPLIALITFLALLGVGLAGEFSRLLSLDNNFTAKFDQNKDIFSSTDFSSCADRVLRTSQFYTVIVVNSGKLIFVLSAYVGIVYQKHKYKGQTDITTFEYDTLWSNRLKHLGRLLIYLALFVTPLALGYGILRIINKVREKDGGNPTTVETYLIQYFGPNLI